MRCSLSLSLSHWQTSKEFNSSKGVETSLTTMKSILHRKLPRAREEESKNKSNQWRNAGFVCFLITDLHRNYLSCLYFLLLCPPCLHSRGRTDAAFSVPTLGTIPKALMTVSCPAATYEHEIPSHQLAAMP